MCVLQCMELTVCTVYMLARIAVIRKVTTYTVQALVMVCYIPCSVLLAYSSVIRISGKQRTPPAVYILCNIHFCNVPHLSWCACYDIVYVSLPLTKKFSIYKLNYVVRYCTRRYDTHDTYLTVHYIYGGIVITITRDRYSIRHSILHFFVDLNVVSVHTLSCKQIIYALVIHYVHKLNT